MATACETCVGRRSWGYHADGPFAASMRLRTFAQREPAQLAAAAAVIVDDPDGAGDRVSAFCCMHEWVSTSMFGCFAVMNGGTAEEYRR